jgi:hypothetical protein
VAGADASPPDAGRHGAHVPRGLGPQGLGGRFGKLFEGPPCSAPEDALLALAADMVEHGGLGEDNDRLPSGYTYLGQFIDHDLTFDPASVLQQDNDPNALTDFRTPALDLDSLYGSGPDVQPYLYDYDRDLPREMRGVRMFVKREHGRTVDLPRNHQHLALLGDARNDENIVVAQLHLLFARFHNILVDRLADETGLRGRALLAEVQQAVRRHYQWIVVHDFLPAFAGPGADRTPRKHFVFEGKPYMPVEFSAAAFRCGHSMIRSRYRINEHSGSVPLFANQGESLRGRRKIPPELRIDWSLFFTPHRGDSLAGKNRAMRIDDRVALPLADIPPDHQILPRLNLLRGRALMLRSGQGVAEAMGDIALDPDEDLRLDTVPEPARTELKASTPLWFYLLREAAMRGDGGQHLGPVGSRIVAEVILGLLEADPASYVNAEQEWTPDLAVDGRFTMHDLIAFVEEHDP